MTIREVADGQSGLPVPNPTESFWHREPSERLLGHRTTPELPETADIVIVGSGITGAFAAHFLKEGNASGSSVVMLEAREACWGATGRNGGHCQPFLYASTPAVAAFELETYRFLKSFVRDNKIPCDWVSLTGVHAFLTQDIFDLAATAVANLEKLHPELAAEVKLVGPSDTGAGDGEETLASLRVPTAKGAVVQRNAAALWPYKLVTWVLERLLDTFPAKGFNLQTNTAVTGLRRQDASSSSSEDDRGWVLTTPRGRITAPKVLLCTNGYTSRLLPAFADLIVPTRSQIAAIIPPRDSTGAGLPTEVDHSYVFLGNYPDTIKNRDDYLIQRPLPSAEFIFGGGRNFAAGLGIGEWRDDVVEKPVSRWLRGNLVPPLDLSSDPPSVHRHQHGRDADRDGDGLMDASFEWTGIMGYSRDQNPWVGAVPESLGGGGAQGGLWVCGGYTGHGMPVAALCACSVAQQIGGDGVRAGGVPAPPHEFRLTEERLQAARSKFQEIHLAQKNQPALVLPEILAAGVRA